MAQNNMTGMEPAETADGPGGEASGTESDAGANVNQQGEFQGNY